MTISIKYFTDIHNKEIHEIVGTRRDGQWMYYQINSELPAWALAVLQQTLSGIGDSEQF